MRKIGIALVVGGLFLMTFVAFADTDRPPTSLAQERHSGQAQELQAKNPGPKRGPIVAPPRPIDAKPVDRVDAMGSAPTPGASVGALVPVTSGGSAVDEKASLERELRRLATRLK